MEGVNWLEERMVIRMRVFRIRYRRDSKDGQGARRMNRILQLLGLR